MLLKTLAKALGPYWVPIWKYPGWLYFIVDVTQVCWHEIFYADPVADFVKNYKRPEVGIQCDLGDLPDKVTVTVEKIERPNSTLGHEFTEDKYQRTVFWQKVMTGLAVVGAILILEFIYFSIHRSIT